MGKQENGITEQRDNGITENEYLVHRRLSTVHVGSLMRPFLIAVCWTYSLLFSITRITDQRHHWWDVLAGMIMGIAIAIYRIFMIEQKIQEMEKENEKKEVNVST
ncbi:hypothetical protein JTB14_007728 [Gonioctena quinquepunctata]|nr:hypothetical protein JTB14_007728 [Gonioctena quinquepunctata]